VDFTDLQAKAEETGGKWNGGQANLLKRIIIENKSTGTSLLLALKRSSVKWVGDLIQPFNPGIADKNERCLQAALWCSMGLVHLPESRIWLDDFYTEELLKVPQCKYRDQSDAFSQLCIYLESYLRRGLVRRRREGKN
jgi:phage terminase large subunit-like protein